MVTTIATQLWGSAERAAVHNTSPPMPAFAGVGPYGRDHMRTSRSRHAPRSGADFATEWSSPDSNRRPPGCDPESGDSGSIRDLHGFIHLAGSLASPCAEPHRASPHS